MQLVFKMMIWSASLYKNFNRTKTEEPKLEVNTSFYIAKHFLATITYIFFILWLLLWKHPFKIMI